MAGAPRPRQEPVRRWSSIVAEILFENGSKARGAGVTDTRISKALSEGIAGIHRSPGRQGLPVSAAAACAPVTGTRGSAGGGPRVRGG